MRCPCAMRSPCCFSSPSGCCSIPGFLFEEPIKLLSVVLIVMLASGWPRSSWLSRSGYPVSAALTVAAGLAQVGEFSFIMAALGANARAAAAGGAQPHSGNGHHLDQPQPAALPRDRPARRMDPAPTSPGRAPAAIAGERGQLFRNGCRARRAARTRRTVWIRTRRITRRADPGQARLALRGGRPGSATSRSAASARHCSAVRRCRQPCAASPCWIGRRSSPGHCIL